MYLHTCPDPVQLPCSVQATPGTLAVNFQQSMPSTKEVPADLNPIEGTHFLSSASPVNRGHRLKMSRASQLGPQRVQSLWCQSEMALGAADPKPLQRLLQSHSVQPGAWSQISPPRLSSPPKVLSAAGKPLMWEASKPKTEGRDCISLQLLSISKGRLNSLYLAIEI